MRQKAENDTSSFYLLLDMMCNAFGGIVFIGLLIAVLSSSMSRQEQDKIKNSSRNLEQVERKLEYEKLSREQKELKAAATHLEETLAKIDQSSSPSAGSDLSVLISTNYLLRDACAALEATNDVLTALISDCINTIQLNLSTSSNLENQIKRLRADLKQRKEESKEIARLPREHTASGQRAVFIAIKDGKFYPISNFSKARPRGYDEEEVVVESGPGRDVIELRKTGGEVIRQGSECLGKFALALNSIQKRVEFISFAVSTNSFAEFNYVKAIIVNHGYSYNWQISDEAIEIVVKEEAGRIQ